LRRGDDRESRLLSQPSRQLTSSPIEQYFLRVLRQRKRSSDDRQPRSTSHSHRLFVGPDAFVHPTARTTRPPPHADAGNSDRLTVMTSIWCPLFSLLESEDLTVQRSVFCCLGTLIGLLGPLILILVVVSFLESVHDQPHGPIGRSRYP
jgi:hypothetical protein